MHRPDSALDYANLIRFKKTHPAWRLLCLDNSPLIISFLHKAFTLADRRTLPYVELVTQLDDYLFFLRSIYGESLYPRSAKEYLEDWVQQENGFLRIYYIQNSDEPEVDLTPATEKVFEWIHGLEQKSFIGTESRLLYLFQLIRDMVSNTEQDASVRLAELEQQKQNIEAEINKVKNGILATYDARQIKERFSQIQDTAQSLISDFRQVEQNFRNLDREIRERIATSDKAKGGILDEIFQEQDVIKDSDQGRSFRGFWEFLMTPERQEELKSMLEKVYTLPETQAANRFLAQIDIHLLEVGERVYRSYNLIAEQLRKFVDSQAYLEQRRISELIKSIERKAISHKEALVTRKISQELNNYQAEIESSLSRPLFTPPRNPQISTNLLQAGQASASLELLFQQYGIDETLLKKRIDTLLEQAAQISLPQILECYPLEQGLAEIITYVHLASKNPRALIDSDTSINISWTSSKGLTKQLTLPNLIFIK